MSSLVNSSNISSQHSTTMMADLAATPRFCECVSAFTNLTGFPLALRPVEERREEMDIAAASPIHSASGIVGWIGAEKPSAEWRRIFRDRQKTRPAAKDCYAAVSDMIKVIAGFLSDTVKETGMDSRATSASQIQRSLEYINEHYREVIHLNDIAEVAGMSPNYFSSTFKAVVGESFIEHLTIVRVGKACELLRNSDMRINEIASNSGFRTISQFNRRFRALCGQSPSQFRLHAAG